MKKIIYAVPIAIMIMLLSNNIYVNASDSEYTGYMCVQNAYNPLTGNMDLNGVFPTKPNYEGGYFESQNRLYTRIGGRGYQVMVYVNGSAVDIVGQNIVCAYSSTISSNQSVYFSRPNKTIIVYSTLDDFYEDVPPEYRPEEDPTWWERVAQIFTEFATSPAMGAVLSGDWLGYINEVLFGELWSVQVGEGEDELAQFYTVSATPSPSPTPIPTQIPVQVNIDPNTGNVTYHYTIDVSGTPVPTSSPINPNPPAGTGSGGSELTEPFGVTDYYEPDDSLSIPNLRIFQFQLDLPGSNTDIGVDSLDNNVELMNGYLEDNADAITTVSSFFQVIPSDWFLLLGAIACFPIIAAMIKSLLGG